MNSSFSCSSSFLGDSVAGVIPDNPYQPFLHVRQIFEAEKGEVVFDPESGLSGLFVLQEGKLALLYLADDGKERVLQIVQPGDLFGEMHLFSEDRAPVLYRSLGRSRVLYYGRNEVMDAIRGFPEFSFHLMAVMNRHMQELIDDLEAGSLLSARQKVIRFLLKNCQLTERDRVEGEVHLPACKSVVASKLNMAPETLSRELKILSDQHLIIPDHSMIYINSLSAIRMASL
jgi:CRP-like cAMP-binding protein